MPSRREFLMMGAATGAYLAVPAFRDASAGGIQPFKVPLRIPPVIEPTAKRGDHDLYTVTMRRSFEQIVPGKQTVVWGFNGHFPGPTFKVRRGRNIVVRRINKLNVPVTTHLHGGKVPARSDGHPSIVVRPGEAYDYAYPNEQEACTLWYHDHTCHHTSRNNMMGLSGLYIIEDTDEEELNLPKGRYDIPLVIQDRTFKPDGSFKFSDNVNSVKGKTYLVNGRPMPFFNVANRKYRFRILNASHTRNYNLDLDQPATQMTQIASDQGLLSAPVPATVIPIWPAERVEVVIDFSQLTIGDRVVLRDLSDPNDPNSGRPIMQFRVAREENDPSSLPPTLRTIDPLLPGPDTVRREFELRKNLNSGRWVINNRPFDAARVDFAPKLGDTEIWTFINRSNVTHPMHIHLVRFQILERRGGQVSPGELGWKDTVRVDASSTGVSVIMRFEGYAGRYMMHCHNLAHEDHSMMSQFRVDKGGGGELPLPVFDGGFAEPRSDTAFAGSTLKSPYRCNVRLRR